MLSIHLSAFAVRLVLAGVFLASGVGKLRSPGSESEAVRALGLPAFLGRKPFTVLVPVGEILLAVLLLTLWGPLGILPAAAAVLLTLAFTVLVARAVASGSGESCNCFGASDAPMSRWTVVRNALLLALSLGVFAHALGEPLGGVSAALGSHPGAALVAAASVVVVGMTGFAIAASEMAHAIGSDGRSAYSQPAHSQSAQPQPAQPQSAQSASASSPGPLPVLDEDDEYRRRPNPAVAVERLRGPERLAGTGRTAGPESRADSERTAGPAETVLTVDLYSSAPVLVLHVSETCGACFDLREREDELAAIAPTLQTVYLFGSYTEAVPDAWKDSRFEIYRDPHDVFAPLAGGHGVPALYLLGADGLLAAGPEYGPDDIMETVKEIAEVLRDVGLQPDDPSVPQPPASPASPTN